MIKIKKIKISAKKKFLSKAERREAENIRKMPDRSPILILLYLIGLFGIMNVLNQAFHLSQNLLIITIGIVEAVSLFLWYMYMYHHKNFIWLVLISCGIALLFIVLNYRIILYNFYQMRTVNAGLSTPLVILMAGVLVFLVFTLEFVTRNHSIMFLFCTAILIFGPLLGIKADAVTAMMIIAFQFGFMVLNMTNAPPRKSLKVKKRAKITALSTAVTAGLLLIAFLPSLIIEGEYEQNILFQIYQADGYIQDALSYFARGEESGIIDGSVSRGNLRQTGDKIFEAKLVNSPKQRIYLSGFKGKNYDGNNWDNAFEHILEPVSNFSDVNSDSYLYSSSVNYSTAYSPYEDENYIGRRHYYREIFMNDLIADTIDQYYFPAMTDVLKDLDIEPTMINFQNHVIYVVDSTKNQFVIIQDNGEIWINGDPSGSDLVESSAFDYQTMPNYPEALLGTDNSDPVNKIYSKDVGFDINQTEKGNRIYISPEPNMMQNILIPYYSSFSKAEISPYSEYSSKPYYNYYAYSESIQDVYAKDHWQGYSTYEYFIEKYMEAIQSEYTFVDTDEMPRLAELCYHTPLNDLNEITTFILYTLQTHADYSTTPGTVPYNKNTIEYFLFDNHRGYCVHFATAAAMMYRMYGIPARYVSGYAVDVNLFQETESSNYHYTADVTDKSAHAWVEIFLKDYGWVPVEVTPTTVGSMIAEYPGYGSEDMNRIMAEHDWHFKKSGTSAAAVDNNNANNNLFGVGELSLSNTFFGLMLISLFVFVLFLIIRWRYILYQQPKMNCRQLFDRLIRALHFSKILTDMNGSEKNFAEELKKSIPEMQKEEAEKLIAILQADNYSRKPVSQEETDFVRKLYIQSAEYLYQQSKWFKKPIFKFIKCFC